MTATTSTTTTAALAASANEIYLTAATGITAGTRLYIGGELVRVASISSLVAQIRRGLDSTRVVAHASGVKVWICPVGVLKSYDPSGTATAASQAYLPVIVPTTGKIWDVENGAWVEVLQDRQTTVVTEGVAVTGVTVAEYGEGRRHLTKLTITALTVDAVAATANEAIGVLLYTFPAGAILIHGAYMSVGIDGTDAACNADTPDVGLGTVIGTGAVATLDGTGTFEDILTGQTAANCTGTATVGGAGGITGYIASSGAHTVHLNVADGWADADTGMIAAGTVNIDWTLLPG